MGFHIFRILNGLGAQTHAQTKGKYEIYKKARTPHTRCLFKDLIFFLNSSRPSSAANEITTLPFE